MRRAGSSRVTTATLPSRSSRTLGSLGSMGRASRARGEPEWPHGVPPQRRGHRDPARLDHPIIDADGHAIEYLPLVRDILREQAGDDAVEVMDLVTGGAVGRPRPHARADARRRTHPHVVVGAAHAQHARPRHRAAARPARGAPARARHRPRGALPDVRARPRRARRRGDPAADGARVQHVLRRGVPRPPRDAHARRHHPDAHAGGGDRRARPRDRRARPEGVHVRRPDQPSGARRRPAVARGALARLARARLAVRLRPGVAAVRRARRVTDVPHRGDGLDDPRSRRATTCSTTSACSRSRARCSRCRCSWAACRSGSRSCASRSRRAASRGRPRCCANLIGHWEKRNRDAVEHYNPAHLDRGAGGVAVRGVRLAALPRAARPARRRPAHAEPPRRGPGDARRVRPLRHLRRRRHPRRVHARVPLRLRGRRSR